MAIRHHFIAVLFGFIAAIFSPTIGGTIFLAVAVLLRCIGQQPLVLGRLLPAFAAVKMMLKMLPGD